MQHRPINPNIRKPAQQLLDFLYSIRGEKTLSAQHDYISSGTRYNDEIAALVGRRPKIMGGDFSFQYRGENPAAYQHCGPANLVEPGHGIEKWERNPAKVFQPEGEACFRSVDLHEERLALVQRCIDWHERGGIITLMWHGPVPDCGDVAGDADLWARGSFPEDRWREILTEGSLLHEAWLKQVDRIAAYLHQLQEAGVPVLWRPYHEMNGGWFWWGLRSDPEWGFPRLWRMLYDRYVHYHKLHNLLWVWNPNAPRDKTGDEAYPYADYYPGSEWVDVLATDVYHNDYRSEHYDGLLQIADGKLIALGEVGHLPSPQWLRDQPLWSWVMPWGGLVFRYNSDDFIKAVYAELD